MAMEGFRRNADGPPEWQCEAICHGFVTADVLVKGLSRGAIAVG